MDYSIRPAEEKDTDIIYDLIRYYAAKGVILERERVDILSSINNFLVVESSGRVIGAATFYDYGSGLKEVRSFAIEEKFHGKGLGSVLLKSLVETVRARGRARIFTLTYKPEFFSKNGFKVTPKEDFPEKIWKDCRNCKDQEKCGETALVLEV